MYPQKEFAPSHVDLEAALLTNQEIRKAIRQLRTGWDGWTDVYGDLHPRKLIREFPDGLYHAWISPEQEFDLLADPSIIDIYQYAVVNTSGNPLIQSSAPSVYGCKFYRTNIVPEIEDEDFVVITGSSLDDKRYTAVFKGEIVNVE